jgi:hypothetical protein
LLRHNAGKYVNINPIRLLRVDQGSFLVCNEARDIAAEFGATIEGAAVKAQEQNWPAEKTWDITRRAAGAAIFTYLLGSAHLTLKSKPACKATHWEPALRYVCQVFPIVTPYKFKPTISVAQAFRGDDYHFDPSLLKSYGAYAFPLKIGMSAMGAGTDNKFVSRSSLGIYIGWDEDSKALLILGPQRTLQIVRHCTILEDVGSIHRVMQEQLPELLESTILSRSPSFFSAINDDDIPHEISQKVATQLFMKPVAPHVRDQLRHGSAQPAPPLPPRVSSRPKAALPARYRVTSIEITSKSYEVNLIVDEHPELVGCLKQGPIYARDINRQTPYVRDLLLKAQHEEVTESLLTKIQLFAEVDSANPPAGIPCRLAGETLAQWARRTEIPSMFNTFTITRCNEPGKIKVKSRLVLNGSEKQLGGSPPHANLSSFLPHLQTTLCGC